MGTLRDPPWDEGEEAGTSSERVKFAEEGNMHLRSLAMVLGAVLLASAAALVSLPLDLRAAESTSNTRSTVAKMAGGPTASTDPGPAGTLLLFVAGGWDLGAPLERELVRQLESTGGISKVTVLDSLPAGVVGPTLVVETRRDVLLWTPAYASASVTTRIVYSSDGDLSWRDDTVVVMGREDGVPQVRVRGDLELEDTTRGVTSRAAYQRHLAQQIASSVSDVLKKQVYASG